MLTNGEVINKDNMPPSTLIRVAQTTRDRLRAKGIMGDSYDSVILKLLDYWDKGHKEEEGGGGDRTHPP